MGYNICILHASMQYICQYIDIYVHIHVKIHLMKAVIYAIKINRPGYSFLAFVNICKHKQAFEARHERHHTIHSHSVSRRFMC